MSRLQIGVNDFYTWCQNNGEVGQQLINEWTGICIDDNKHYGMNEVTKASNKRFQWKCSKNIYHTWSAVLAHRTLNKTGCPYCAGQIVAIENSFQTWCQNNAEWGNQLLNEWTGHCIDDNKQYTTDKVTKASNKKFQWKCFKNPLHTWNATVSSRTYHRTGCPYCSLSGTSYPEQVIYRSLKQIFPQTISRGKFKGYEFDITIPEVKTCIEYSGVNWHIDRIYRDNEKAAICKEHGVNFIQIYGHSGELDSEDIFDGNFIIYKIDRNKHNDQLKYILSQILNQFKHSISEIDFDKVYSEALEYEGSVQKNINDLQTWCLSNGEWGQLLLKEWTGYCSDNNKCYNPNEVTKATDKKFKWICSKDPSHIWEARICHRTLNKTGCPYCSKNRIVTPEKSLYNWCVSNGDWGQQLLQEWTGYCVDDNKKYTPNEVTKTSNKKFKWKCSKDPSHIWCSTIGHRTYSKSGCPYCSIDSQGRLKHGVNDLLTWCQNNGDYGQQLLKEWTGHCIGNNKIYTPDEVSKGSGKKFVWKCTNGHEWCKTICDRTYTKSSCPKCKKYYTLYKEGGINKSGI